MASYAILDEESGVGRIEEFVDRKQNSDDQDHEQGRRKTDCQIQHPLGVRRGVGRTPSGRHAREGHRRPRIRPPQEAIDGPNES